MRIVAIIKNKFGKRFVDHLHKSAPTHWEVVDYLYEGNLPIVIDDPQEFLPQGLPVGDLLLFLGQNKKLAELIPDISEACKVKAVIAPVEHRALLPSGLGNQIKRRLSKLGIDVVFPDPFCSLTEERSENPLIKEFARHFGKPELKVSTSEGEIKEVSLIRGAPCGNTLFVAERLLKTKIREGVEKAGLLHHAHPCMASMDMDREIGETLLHRAGMLVRMAVEVGLKVTNDRTVS